LAASVIDAAKKVLWIAIRSGNIKGIYIKVLRDVAAAITVGATLLSKRVAEEGGENTEILDEVRSENQRLRTSHEEMKKEIEELKD
ncbi:hypothetical protein EAI_04115, partial [Harpegnathos saltator]